MSDFSIMVDKKKAVSPEVRCSYVYLLEPRPLEKDDPPDKKPEYSMMAVMPKTENALAFIEACKPIYFKVLMDKFKTQDRAQQVWQQCALPWHDGDDPQWASKELPGHIFFNPKGKFRQPFFIGPMGKPVDPATLTEDDIYSGMWGRCMLEFYHYNRKGNQGIGIGLAAFLKTRDDERLGGGTTAAGAEEAMSDFVNEAMAFGSAISGTEEAAPSADSFFNDLVPSTPVEPSPPPKPAPKPAPAAGPPPTTFDFK